MQQFAELRSKQEDELLRRQELLQQSHDRLAENSNTILAAQVGVSQVITFLNLIGCFTSENYLLHAYVQEAFESKQASMFVALDKLFALHNAMLLESRLLKAFIVYAILIFVVYMFTSTKQTYAMRPRLYLGMTYCHLHTYPGYRFSRLF